MLGFPEAFCRKPKEHVRELVVIALRRRARIGSGRGGTNIGFGQWRLDRLVPKSQCGVKFLVVVPQNIE